ncbi:MAG TPA: carboxypeptidase regulatory-like domain-containing protein [Vicinamibacterales bacterium]|jgi:hypothetical protein|nr:carboxypeptidase regulatory-like domain-containing protein [Vicinamibacterales bacterium]
MNTRVSSVAAAVAMVAFVYLNESAVQEAADTGSITGVVRDADSGVPLENVALAYSGASRGTAITDAQGRYYVANVPPGTVRVSMRPLLVGDAPLLVSGAVSAGRTATLPDLRVRLFASISGSVRADDGLPLPGVTVVAIIRRYSRMRGWPSLQDLSGGQLWDHVSGSTVTDDRGTFHLEHLPGGQAYYVLAIPRREVSPSAGRVSASGGLPTRRPRYYPSVDSIEAAVPVVLTSRQERRDVDITLSTERSFCMSAQLEGATNAASEFAVLDRAIARLVAGVSGSTPSYWNVRPAPGDGHIQSCGLYNGEFTFVAGAPINGILGPTARNDIAFEVANADVDVGVLSVAEPVTKEIAVSWKRSPPQDIASRLALIIVPASLQTRIDAIPSRFQARMSLGVPYVLAVPGLQAPLYVSDLLQNGRTAMGQALDAADPGDIELLIGSDGGTISAQVMTESGEPATGSLVLALFNSSHPGRFLVASAALVDENGKVTMSGLPPGSYRTVALKNPPPFAVVPGLVNPVPVLDPTPLALDYLMRLAPSGKLITVNSSGAESLTLSTD